MVRIARILRDYSEAGGVNSLLPLWGFVDGGSFMTKAGHVGVVYELRGVDVDGLTQAQRRSLTHHMEAALRQLDERCRLYQYVVKRTVDTFVAPPCVEPVAQEALSRRTAYLNERRHELYELTQYIVLLREEPTQGQVSTRLHGIWREPREAFRRWLSTHRSLQLLESELENAIERLLHQAEAFESQLCDFGLARLARSDAFHFFRQLVNYDQAVLSAVPPSTPETYLDYFVADSPVECHRDHLMVGSRHVKVLSMKEPPAQTFAHILGDLLAVPGEFIACLEWQRAGQDRMRREIQTRRRHFFNKRVALINYVSPEAKAEEMLVDESATATVKQLGDALTEMEVNGHVFGRCSLTVVLHSEHRRTLDHQVAQAMKVLSAHDGAFFSETYNQLNAWVSIVPGNGARNLRRMAVLETHAADLSFLFGIDQGQPDSALLSDPLAVFETPHHTPFAYHLHVQDVGHTLVLGATGSGKSFLLNFLVTSAQQYDPFTIVLDLGHGYRKLAALLHGGYVELGLRQRGVRINPFSMDPTPEHLHFLHGFVRVLLEGEDGYRLSELEDREVYEAVENLYVLDRNQRRLFTLANLLPRALMARLQRWVEGGR
ncbi:MAG TPA: hypothetical protein VFZ73_07700, partial [Gemmatimonadaceae bacterium]